MNTNGGLGLCEEEIKSGFKKILGEEKGKLTDQEVKDILH